MRRDTGNELVTLFGLRVNKIIVLLKVKWKKCSAKSKVVICKFLLKLKDFFFVELNLIICY